MSKKSRGVQAGPGRGKAWSPDDETREQIKVLCRIDCSNDEIAAVIGIARSTFQEALVREPELRRLVDDSRLNGVAGFKRLLWEKAREGSSKALGLLAARYGWSEKDGPAVNVNVGAGGTVVIQVPHNDRDAVDPAAGTLALAPPIEGDDGRAA